jgi:hypothetical protein
MTDTANTALPEHRDSRCRVSRPERIDIGDDTLVRNDVKAGEEGRSDASLNAEDSFGAPYTYVGGVKYRPEKLYREYRMSRIRQATPSKRRNHRR